MMVLHLTDLLLSFSRFCVDSTTWRLGLYLGVGRLELGLGGFEGFELDCPVGVALVDTSRPGLEVGPSRPINFIHLGRVDLPGLGLERRPSGRKVALVQLLKSRILIFVVGMPANKLKKGHVLLISSNK